MMLYSYVWLSVCWINGDDGDDEIMGNRLGLRHSRQLSFPSFYIRQ